MSKKPLRYFAQHREKENKAKQHDVPQILQQEDEEDDEEGEDYMSMVFEDAEPSRGKETYSQKIRRKTKESELRARAPSKAEQKAQEDARREAALSSSINNPANKGFQIMAKLGYKPGMALGKPEEEAPPEHGGDHTSNSLAGEKLATNTLSTSQQQQQQQQQQKQQKRLLEPLSVAVKDDRGGIGMDSDKKRKSKETLEQEMTKRRAEETDYWERVRSEREEARFEGLFRAAQAIIENLQQQAEDEEESMDDNNSTSKRLPIDKRPLSQIDVILRGLIRSRREQISEQLKGKEQVSRRAPAPLLAKLSADGKAESTGTKKNIKLPGIHDDLDPDDRIALGKDLSEGNFVFEEMEDEDADLATFSELPAKERFHQANMYLREKFFYCFWCKYRYKDTTALGTECPGTEEEDHD